MKNKLYFFLLTALMGLFGMNASAQDPYEISTAQDLVDFAKTVNGGDYDANAVLTADIDMTGVDISVFPIGGPDTGKRYVGTFDGQGHKISNFKLINPSAATNFGMFNTNTGVVLKNFWLDSSCEIEGREIVSLIGRHDGGGYFEGIGNCADVTGTNNNVGGLFGAVMGNSNDKKNVTIKNCWTANKVTSTNTSASNYKDCGALSGWFNNAIVTITNFWTIAEVANYKSESTYIIRSGGGVSFTNCTGCYSKFKADTQEKVSFTAIVENEENGELCFKMNEDLNDNVWFQNLDDGDVDEVPLPYSNHGTVYKNATYLCPNKTGDDVTYSNANSSVIPDHDYVDCFCTICGYLEQDNEGYFEISKPDHLAWFATHVNDVNHAANAKLTADLDMTDVEVAVIGNNPTNAFKGTFDGQGHEISNYSLTIDGTFVAGYGYGMFGNTSGATIKDFTIDGDITLTGSGSGDYGGALVGWPDGGTLIQDIKSSVNIDAQVYSHMGGIAGSLRTATIDRCEFAGTLNGNASGNGASGIAGYTNNGTITNCIFSGTVEGTGSGYFAGILGYVNSTAATIKNCLSYGQVDNTNSQYTSALVARLRNIGTFSNTYHTSGKSIGGGEKAGDETIVANATKVTDEQLASGEVCYLLNGDQSEIVFFQTLPDDEVPTLDDTHETVYAAGTTCPNGHPQGVTYSNTPGGAVVVKPHAFVDGFCTYCEVIDEDYIIPNSDDFLEIGTPAQLKWFAVYVNQVEPASNAMLTADIDLAGVTMPSIGNSSVAYAGRFYGQGNAISNFEATSEGYGGFFGKTNGADIRDFSISGTLTVAAGTGSGVVGWAENSTISNIQSALVIEVPNSGAHHTGGVVGSARGTNVIDRCSFSGSMTIAAGSTDNFAGVVAYITHTTTTRDVVTNCANYGDITFSDAGCAAGGILGYINSANAIVNNCLNTGSITFNGEGSPKFGGAILGRTKNTDFTKITNNFWLEGSANGASKKDDGSDPVATGSVTAEQLASGEVAYKLGEAWSQIIGTDDVPVLGTDAPVFYVGEAGYATLYDTTTGYNLNGDVKAYAAVLNNTWLELSEIPSIPESTPVVLKGGYYNKLAADLPAINVANDLKGTDVDTAADGTMYVLAKPAEKEVGFYQATGTIPAGKAYFQSNAGVKAFFFDGDDATGIENLNNQNTLNTPIYNLAGQRMSKMQKGINIVDGKKILK